MQNIAYGIFAAFGLLSFLWLFVEMIGLPNPAKEESFKAYTHRTLFGILKRPIILFGLWAGILLGLIPLTSPSDLDPAEGALVLAICLLSCVPLLFLGMLFGVANQYFFFTRVVLKNLEEVGGTQDEDL